jgi:uncharacterized protein
VSGGNVADAYFFDSSAIVKRYVRETGTGWVRRLTRRGQPDPIYLARITAVDLTSAVARRRASGTPTPARARSILALFRSHLATRYLIMEISPALADAAMRWAERTRTANGESAQRLGLAVRWMPCHDHGL